MKNQTKREKPADQNQITICDCFVLLLSSKMFINLDEKTLNTIAGDDERINTGEENNMLEKNRLLFLLYFVHNRALLCCSDKTSNMHTE